jgi:UDP-N-acetylmuramate--alanine ligase
MLGRTKKIHFVGIGGIGMSGMAELLLNQGFTVSGSDLKTTPITRRLEGLGVAIRRGHDPEHVRGRDVVVFSSAVWPTNPEVEEAKRLQIPVIPRNEMLGELMRIKYAVAVAGSHGKTTTTSLVATVLGRGGLDPTFLVGGRLNAWGTNARLGASNYFVAEVDESDGKFVDLPPTLTVTTNIDAEHLDHYRDVRDIQDAFVTFMNRVPFFGGNVVCLDEESIREILPRLERRVLTYGLESEAEVRGTVRGRDPEGIRVEVQARNSTLGEMTLRIPGRHNVANALAAVTVGLELEIPFEKIRRALESFAGVGRRFEVKGEAGGVLVVDDYGHHPTEIAVTLAGAKENFERRTVVAFQPHRYSRTQALYREFGRSFDDADVLFVTDVYPAGERPIEGVTSKLIVDELERRGHDGVHSVGGIDELMAEVVGVLRAGDVFITLGAGDIGEVGDRVLGALRGKGEGTG